MGLFDDIPMVGDARVRRQNGFDPAAGQMPVWPEPPEMDEEQPELSGPVRVAQRGVRVGPSPAGVPPGVWVPPGILDEWRKTFIQGMMGAQRFFRQGAGSGSSGGNNDDCHERFDSEFDRCERFRPWGSRTVDACRERASERRTKCIRNGGKPDPREPLEYDFRDIQN